MSIVFMEYQCQFSLNYDGSSTVGFALKMRIQWSYSHYNWVKSDAAIPQILKVNQIHQNLPHLECFRKRKRYPMFPATIHPMPPPNGCGWGGLNYYYYNRHEIYIFPIRNHAKCAKRQGGNPSINSNDVFYLYPSLIMHSIYRTRHPICSTAIHPMPPPNGCQKGRINFHYYTRY